MPVSDADIDNAVPAGGIPSRSLTNAVLKEIRTIAQNGENAASFVQRVASPADGSTVEVNQVRQNGIVILEPSNNLAALTIRLPVAPNQRDGQIIRLVTTKDISSLSFVDATLLNGIDTMLANDAFAFQVIDDNTWVRTVG
ncbi:TPA: hypothetical protein L4A96_004968 [Pseudomonas aeruginosa]|uniref:hypothetical protein n=1 Tax=Pseudomonas aeruginosa TaxID=287 RepID=UPI00066EBB49|nr:hypothetical protein [Pseudomonas aeruginosa]AVR83641.1 hypothetical protein C8257_17510 [Pseudomonas aeruginosa]EIU2591064.1 hypothetical protein [Pseudomonas aeruginosa]EIU2693014.1 hypothetical protein [Pseudomonas aeruginosa]EIU2839486.1 hypothetical protein [Pseudomonas aeruginosa]EIU9470474.1 hypothetical protein [Pseudomonas aeruginosa]